MTCNLSITLGTAFTLCLSLLLCAAAAFIAWHSSRLFHDWKHARALTKGQDALLNYHYTPLGERQRKPRADLAKAQAAVVRMERPAPQEVATVRAGWQRRADNPYNIAAE